MTLNWHCTQDVYAEDLVHRSPGDASTLTPIETAFEPLAQSWVAAETDTGAAEGAGGSSFTRVMIGQVKPNILRQIADEPGMQQLCRDLSHLYHYYLHGPQGSRGHRQAGSPARDGPLPEITIQCITGSRTAWTVNLADITDDMESQYLQVTPSLANATIALYLLWALEVACLLLRVLMHASPACALTPVWPQGVIKKQERSPEKVVVLGVIRRRSRRSCSSR